MTTQPTNQFPPEFYTPEFWQQYPDKRYAYSDGMNWTLTVQPMVYISSFGIWTFQSSDRKESAVTLHCLDLWQGDPKDSLFINPFRNQ